jgi:hypothetical protein
VELCAPKSGPVDDLDDALRRLVAEHADGEHLGGQPLGDVGGDGCRDLSGRGREDEAERVGTHGDGEQGIVLARRPADLDEHRGEATGAVAHRPGLSVDEAVVEVVVIGGQVQETVTAVGEQDDPLLA